MPHPISWQFGQDSLASAQERQQLDQQIEPLQQPAAHSANGEVKVLPSRKSRPIVDVTGSTEASNYLHQHRLPYVSAQISRNPSGAIVSVVLTGQVRTALGKWDAERKVRELLGASTLAIVNEVQIEPQLIGVPQNGLTSSAQTYPLQGQLGTKSTHNNFRGQTDDPLSGPEVARRPLSMLNGCWRRLARRAECSFAAVAGSVRCSIPDHFHLQEVCFDEIENGALRMRVSESRSHTYRGEIEDLDPSDHADLSGVGRISGPNSDDRFDVQLSLAPEYSANSSLGGDAEHSYGMQVVYGRRTGQTPGSIYISANGHWSCGHQNYFNTMQSGEFVRNP